MRTIILNEEQINRLFEANNYVPNFDGGDIKEFPSSTDVSSTANIHNSDGNLEYGEGPTTDDIANKLTPQQWGARHGRRGGFGI